MSLVKAHAGHTSRGCHLRAVRPGGHLGEEPDGRDLPGRDADRGHECPRYEAWPGRDGVLAVCDATRRLYIDRGRRPQPQHVAARDLSSYEGGLEAAVASCLRTQAKRA